MTRRPTASAMACDGAPIERRRVAIPLPALAILGVLAVLGVCLTACGSSRSGGAQPVSAASTTTAVAAAHRYRNDEDKDATGDGDGDESTGLDTDEDYAEDHPPNPRNDLYHDRDDAGVVDYGRPATANQAHAIAPIVTAYTTMAATQRGDAACRLLAPNLAHSLPQDYGGPNGSPSARANTCGAVLARLFHTEHGRLEPPCTITSVRVQGNNADALCGSTTAPASLVALVKEADRWRIDSVLPQPLP